MVKALICLRTDLQISTQLTILHGVGRQLAAREAGHAVALLDDSVPLCVCMCMFVCAFPLCFFFNLFFN